MTSPSGENNANTGRRKWVFPLGIVAGIILCFQTLAQQKGNLHGTVTQDADSHARMPVTDHSHRRNTMPQNDKDFGDYAGLVTIFKHFITEELPSVERKGMAHGIPLSTYDYKKWTKKDLTILAGSYNGLEQFDILIGLKNAAVGISENDKPLTPRQMQCAQNALTELMPNSCKSWKKFYDMIADVQDETEEKRAYLRELKEKDAHHGSSGAILDLDKFNDVAGDPMDALDQQKALALLEKNAVKMDSEHSLKSPDPKAVALDAVKVIKGSVRAA